MRAAQEMADLHELRKVTIAKRKLEIKRLRQRVSQEANLYVLRRTAETEYELGLRAFVLRFRNLRLLADRLVGLTSPEIAAIISAEVEKVIRTGFDDYKQRLTNATRKPDRGRGTLKPVINTGGR